MRLFSLVVILALACLAQADFDPATWTGKWTFNDGSMTICVNSTRGVQGLFGTFYINGEASADGNTITGEWWDTQIWYEYPALVAATKTTKCCTQNRGSFTMTRITIDLFEVRMAFEDKSIEYYKFGPRVLARFDDASPTNFSCFYADINTGKDISGSWASRLGRTNTAQWDICIEASGDKQIHKGSYEYTYINGYGNNFTAKGYSEGECFFGNSFCWVDWFEDASGTKSHGGYILSLGYADAMYGIYDFGTQEIYLRTDKSDSCTRNSNIKYKYYINSTNKVSLTLLPVVLGLFALFW